MDDPTLMTSSFKLKETYPTNDNDLLNSLGDINEKTFEKSINEIFSRRERIIIKSLLNFDRENTEMNTNHFTYRTPDYALNANVKKEKELFGKIEQIMRKYFNTSEKETKINKHSHENKTISNSLAVIVVKDIIVAVINVIREWTENKITEHFANGDDEEKENDIFEEIYNEYVLGGIEYMYETFVAGCVEVDDYTTKIFEAASDFQDEINELDYSEEVKKYF